MSSTASRISAAERAMSVLRPGLRTIMIRGGLQSGIADHAEIDGRQIGREPDESPDAFRARATAAATASGARTIIFGGLPKFPTGGDGD
jgi:hypothetical protein